VSSSAPNEQLGTIGNILRRKIILANYKHLASVHIQKYPAIYFARGFEIEKIVREQKN
jgi:hypothetical protein